MGENRTTLVETVIIAAAARKRLVTMAMCPR
jgi:hypothetical protein